jgi:hypothetical protein
VGRAALSIIVFVGYRVNGLLCNIAGDLRNALDRMA